MRIGPFIHQNINSYLAIALIAVMAFWTVLFYVTHKAEAIGQAQISQWDLYAQ